ncbi:IclR family transcriptional regulator [Acinetobacter baumannii]|uniref:IclR family transcriptional regulator n=1 Tax=Acinetobacter baumannii TaxID=470 RepID=UPI003B42CFC7
MVSTIPSTSIPALDKVMLILNYLSDHPGKKFAQIQEDLKLPRSSTSSLLNSLLIHNLIRKEKNLFFLGTSLTVLGHASLEQRDICHIAKPIMAELRNTTQLTCHLGVLQNTVAIYLLKMESHQPVSINTWIGKNLSLHSSGIGKVLCAWLPEDELLRLFPEEELEGFTQNTITTRTKLFQEFENIRMRGFAYDNEEDSPGVNCIACPIFDNQNNVQAAISMSGVGNQFLEQNREKYSHFILNSAYQIQKQIWG